MGANISPGENILFKNHLVRHEDLTKLSFANASFDIVVTQDVFEHIGDYKAAFSEYRRVLTSKGIMAFTIPFFPNQKCTEIRVQLNSDGYIQYLLTPEYHSNPVGDRGSLCFQHFGWDILDTLRQVGFSIASAHLYWGPWQGHFGIPFFIFSAQA